MRLERTRAALVVAAAALTAVCAAPAIPAVAAAKAWSEVAAPNPAVQFSYLTSVDGRTDTDAWAVGYVQPPSAAPFQPIALHWAGSGWTNVPVPQLGDGTVLYGVSADQAGDAWAVGNFFSHPAGYRVVSTAAALHWTGTGWTSTPVPDSGLLAGVAAVSPTNAWAIGNGVKHWDGVAWSDVSTPSPNPSGTGPGSLNAISARTATDVWAVGTFAPRRHVTASFALHFDGSTWRLVPVPAGVELWSVSSVADNDAWAVGQLDGLTTEPATLHWDGTAWRLVASPTVPAGAYLRAVSARGTGDVWAVGPAFTGEAGSVAALTIHWNGSAWSTASVSAATVSPDLWSVSARSATHVWATGDKQPGVPLILERH